MGNELPVWLVSRRGSGGAVRSRKTTGDRPAAVTGADWQMLQARLIRRCGTGEQAQVGQ